VCPDTEGSVDLDFNGGLVEMSNAVSRKLCTLVEIDVDGHLKPVARSYHSYNWEASAGPYSILTFKCTADLCTTDLPVLKSGAKYQLTTFNAPSYFTNSKDKAAKYLERSTFGPTLAEIEAMAGSGTDIELSYANWIRDHMTTVPLTSHREFYRKHMNSRFEFASPVGPVTHPCQKGTRYRKFTFSAEDTNKILTIVERGENKFMLIIDGFIRTIVDGPITGTSNIGREVMTFGAGSYKVSNNPPPREYIGGRVNIEYNTKYYDLKFNGIVGNPAIAFDDVEPHTKITLQDNEAKAIDEDYIEGMQEILVTRALSDAACSFIGEPDNPLDTVIAKYKGELWVHDPRFEWMDNSMAKPAEDGGGAIVKANTNFGNPDHSAICSNAPRSFLNEETCFLSTSKDACAADSGIRRNGPTFDIPLENATMRVLYEESGAGNVGTLYLYAVAGLRIEDDDKVKAPCDPSARGTTSRWVPDNCSPRNVVVAANTESLFVDLIATAITKDPNPNVVDVTLKSSSGACAEADQKKKAFVVKNSAGNCWRNVHADHLNVHDFTPWTRAHPGNSRERNPIKEFTQSGNHTLVFPSWHEMDRWQTHKTKFRLFGRLGDKFNYYNIPQTFRTDVLNDAVGFDPEKDAESVNFADANTDSSGTLICGSPNEIANVPALGGSLSRGAFASHNIRQFGSITDSNKQKRVVWTNTVIDAKDQLRQRVAWVLAQILVVSTGDISGSLRYTEMFTMYYDIFVRHAFGNYRDILKEVSYTPAMADMLTYYRSKSTAYEYKRSGSVQFADENFAREIMQLFTTGLYKLDSNGNRVFDTQGGAVEVYSNNDIQEYARVWTGFNQQVARGNVETAYSFNHLDPMKIEAAWRDHFPKMGLDRKYIGDAYPLCADLPKKHFLLKGATYRLLGLSAAPQLQQDPKKWLEDPLAKRVTLATNGGLFGKLCGSTNPSSCSYASTVVLDEPVLCTGVECSVDSFSVVEVGVGIFYEYVRSPCVYQAFYDNAKLVSRIYSKSRDRMCADPRTEAASTACCPDGHTANYHKRYWNDAFWGEKSVLVTAANRCEQKLCTSDARPTCYGATDGSFCSGNYAPYWTDTDCKLRVKIDEAGNAAIVHAPNGVDDTDVQKKVQEDTKTFFRVDWSDEIVVSNIISTCASISGCSKTVDDMCMCDITISEQRVFTEVPSKSEVLKSLHIGAFAAILSGTQYTKHADNQVTWYNTGDTLSADTVFEVIDNAGVIQLRKNMQSVVNIVGAPVSFRNPVHFMSLEDAEPRDAHHETDAALDHYFYHPNTAPFLAIRFAQRFGISNPSPRYVGSIAAAFTTGKFTFENEGETISYGSGKYGDLEATVACVLLDREARSTVLDADPIHGSLKEPLMKIVGLMRSLDFKLDKSVPFIDFKYEIGDDIGQMAHAIPSVFSFFLPEHKAPGKIAMAEIVAPEAQQTTGPKIVNLMNGLLSLIKYGLDPCYSGLGTQPRDAGWTSCWNFALGDFTKSAGRLMYNPSASSSAKDITDELATLMTAGRLSADSRKIVEDVLSSEANTTVGLIKAQALIATSPEFHTTNVVRKTGQDRPKPTIPLTASSKSESKLYKAVVHVMIAGGFDSYHMLVPHTCTDKNAKGKNVREQYNDERTTLAYTDGERTRIIDATGQPCSQFAVHPDLKVVEELYKTGDLAFFANTGVLNAPSTKKTYSTVTKTNLFSHNMMQEEVRKTDPFNDAPGTGILGRMCDKLEAKGFNTQPVTLSDVSIATVGVPGNSADPLIMSSKGLLEFNPKPSKETFNPREILEKLNDETELHSSVYGETWSSRLLKALADEASLKTVLDEVVLTQKWERSHLSDQLKMASTVIASHKERNTERDVIYLEVGGWDHHRDMKARMSTKLKEVNQALASFKDEMTEANLWDNVSLVITSDFGRTLTVNSGDGSDHAWGGNYFVMGGAVKGGQILGQYPTDLTVDGPVNIGRGRLIPTTSWESIWSSVVEWMGLETTAELDYCLPNREKTGSKLYAKDEVFWS